MLPFRVVYHDDYDLKLGDHVFPSVKYKRIHDQLLLRGIAAGDDFVQPEPASDQDLLLVHAPDWVERLKHRRLTDFEILRLEVPLSPALVRGFWLAAGGSILAARLALEDRISVNIGGGFHHAYPDHGEGFCAINDIAVAIRRLQRDEVIERAMVVDCDVHHGNGTAAIFSGDDSVFTFSIHQYNNYPADKPPSDMDIHLPDGVGDEEYLEHLRHACLPAIRSFRPQLLVYVAGADPYREDQLGGLALSISGLKARDRLVLDAAVDREVPVVVVPAGGYAQRVDETIRIHVNTIIAGREALDPSRGVSRPLPA